MAKQLLICSCAESMALDHAAIAKHTGLACARPASALCTRELPQARAAIEAGEVIIACQQESARFKQLAQELGAPEPLCVDIRDRAGWGTGARMPKIAALLQAAQIEAPPVRTMDVESTGQCLLIGAGETVFQAAAQLSTNLAVTVLQLCDSAPPLDRRFEVIRGRIAALKGSLGAFELRLDAVQHLEPSGRGAFGFTAPRDGARTSCDVIVDLSGNAPLVPAPEKRDGYWRADPKSPTAVADALAEAATAVGVFEKPIYLSLDETLCAHSRAQQTGCSRCLNACPTGAITPAGEHVAVDPLICAGCGACAALCPSGAITYDAPPVQTTLQRIASLGSAYAQAGGQNARLLVHDDAGGELIAYAARFEQGLPGHVVPLHLPSLPLMGHAEMLAALTSGFCAVDVLLSPKADRDTLEAEIALAAAMGADTRVALIDTREPSTLCAQLAQATYEPMQAEPILALGGRRQVARLAGKALGSDTRPLPSGAPYGRVQVNTDACTLCLSCVSLCPSGALLDNPDKPQLRFQEDACLQCGICKTACPENAITLEPRFNPSDSALSQVVLHEEEPFCCIECGVPFGVKSTVERIFDSLAGKHPMFAEGPAGRLIKMCDDCRIKAQFQGGKSPMAAGARPPIATAEARAPGLGRTSAKDPAK